MYSTLQNLLTLCGESNTLGLVETNLIQIVEVLGLGEIHRLLLRLAQSGQQAVKYVVVALTERSYYFLRSQLSLKSTILTRSLKLSN